MGNVHATAAEEASFAAGPPPPAIHAPGCDFCMRSLAQHSDAAGKTAGAAGACGKCRVA
jgi:hypothetical protein